MFSKSSSNKPTSELAPQLRTDRSQEQMFRADCINQAFVVGKNSTKGDQLEDTRGIDTRPEENFALVF